MQSSEISPGERAQAYEAEKQAEDFKEFFSETLPFVDARIILQKNPDELISILKEYWNTPASFDHFRDLMTKYGEKVEGVDWSTLEFDAAEQNEDVRTFFKDYLFNKLPEELKERWQKDLESGAKTIDDLYDAVADEEHGLIIGFNTSPADISGEVIKAMYSEDEMREPAIKKYVEEKGSKAWYSLDEKKLFPGKSPKYFYIVEGSRSDLTSGRYYNKEADAIYSHSNLRIRYKMPLTDAIMKKFGLKFVKPGIAI